MDDSTARNRTNRRTQAFAVLALCVSLALGLSAIAVARSALAVPTDPPAASAVPATQSR